MPTDFSAIALRALHATRDNWGSGGDMGQPNGFLAREGSKVFAVRLELWSDDCLMDCPRQTPAEARKRGKALAKRWAKAHWPHTGYEELGGAEGIYGATWAIAPSTAAERRAVDPEDVLDLSNLRENPAAPALRRVSPGLYVTQDGMWEVSRVDYTDHAWWVFKSSAASDKLVEHLSVGHVGAEDFFPTKAVAVETLFYCLAHAEEYPSIARRLAALAKVPRKNPVDVGQHPDLFEFVPAASHTPEEVASNRAWWTKQHSKSSAEYDAEVLNRRRKQTAVVIEDWRHASPEEIRLALDESLGAMRMTVQELDEIRDYEADIDSGNTTFDDLITEGFNSDLALDFTARVRSPQNETVVFDAVNKFVNGAQELFIEEWTDEARDVLRLQMKDPEKYRDDLDEYGINETVRNFARDHSYDFDSQELGHLVRDNFHDLIEMSFDDNGRYFDYAEIGPFSKDINSIEQFGGGTHRPLRAAARALRRMPPDVLAEAITKLAVRDDIDDPAVRFTQNAARAAFLDPNAQADEILGLLDGKPSPKKYMREGAEVDFHKPFTITVGYADKTKVYATLNESFLEELLSTPKGIDMKGNAAFEAWFGESKVVDEQGRPLVCFHGTNKGGFSVFSKSKIDSHHVGFFFTDRKAVAHTYTRARPAKDPTPAADVESLITGLGSDRAGMYEVFLRMEKPFIVDAEETQWNRIMFEGRRVKTDELTHIAKAGGYDGVIIQNVHDSGGEGNNDPLGNVYVIFDPNQVKSALLNRGTFSRTDDDIRHNPKPRRRR